MDSSSEVVTTVPEVEPSQSAKTVEENKEIEAPNTVETVTITTKENVEKDEDDTQTKTTTTTTVKVAKKENGEETTTTTTTTTVSVEAPSPDDAVAATAESQEVEVEPKTETKVETVTETSTTKAPEPQEADAQTEKESKPVAEASAEPKAEKEDTVSVKEDTQVESEEIEEGEETESEAEEDDAEEEDNDEEEEAEEKSNVSVDQPSKDPVEVKPETNQESVSVTLKAPSTKTTEIEENTADSVDQADAPTDIKSSTNKKDFNDQIQDIISDIDVNIKAQEKITKLKEQELQLIQKQQELANQIRQQQILAQQLIAQNELKQQQLNAQQQSVPQAYDVKESTNVSKAVDLRKIFTPATDAPEILPKNRKLYASSAFYSPSLHPTVEDQVELARRISHSLSDISNQKSKGQSMFVNRKKRSVKWVHEGCAQDYQQYQPRPTTSPNIVPAYSDAGKHRVQLNIHQDQLIEKYSKPGLQVVKSPWEAALQTGSASSAFQEETRYRSQTPIVSAASPSNYDREDFSYSGSNRPFVPPPSASVQQEVPYTKPSVPTPVNPQRELAYKPSVAQGWGGRNVELPRGLYIPKEISLASYVPPPNQYQAPAQSQYQPAYPGQGFTSNDGVSGASNYASRFAPTNESSASFSAGGNGAFPLSRPTSGFNTSSVAPGAVPRQQFNAPSSYQKVPQGSSQSAPPVNFNPSPLSFDKLSKFEQPDQYQGNSYGSPSPHPQQQRYLNPRYGSNVRNTSPSPFGLGASSPVDPVLSSPISTPNLGQQQSLNKYQPYRPAPAQNQSFNNCARGWGSGLGSARQGAPVPRGTIASAGNLPYSDF
ncbi:probable serine/threonine-protein kinase kinX isoform X8 [Drosophila tropicalis]|uniref:probable serine/threonine-protein kinase kinX isoform X8 n=1 Tax=Drosophila tropicalis TaxID=46794 RepID=UPI0035ABB533